MGCHGSGCGCPLGVSSQFWGGVHDGDSTFTGCTTGSCGSMQQEWYADSLLTWQPTAPYCGAGCCASAPGVAAAYVGQLATTVCASCS
jgi:hypothetical protein